MPNRPIRSLLAAATAGATLLLAACGGGSSATAPTAGAVQASAMPMSADDQETGRALDVAVSGDGLLVAHDPLGGEPVYTRWGRLDLDADGHLVHAQGWRMGGVTADVAAARAGDDLAAFEAPLPPVPWRMPFKPDTLLAVEVNLDSAGLPIEPWIAFDPGDPISFDNASSFTVFDAEGLETTLTLYYRRLPIADDGSPCALVFATVQGRRVLADGPDGEWRRLCFQPDGSLVAGTEDSPPLRVAPAPAGEPAHRLDGLVVHLLATSFASSFGISGIEHDGFPTGHLSSVTIAPEGRITLAYDNGQSVDHGWLVLARPAPDDRYRRVDAVGWRCAGRCATPAITLPGRRLSGSLRQGWLARRF